MVNPAILAFFLGVALMLCVKLVAERVEARDEATSGGKVTPVLAKGPLTELIAELQQEHGAAQVIDARRPKQEAVAAAPATEASGTRRWNMPGTMAALAAMMGFVLEDSMSI